MTDLWTRLKTRSKPIFIYGMGNGAQKLFGILEKYKIPVCGVFASDEFVRDKYFNGFKIKSYGDVRREYGDIIVLTAFGSNRRNVIDNIIRIAGECELYAPDIPVYGNTLFNNDYFHANIKDLEFVRSLLSDEYSKNVFDSIVNYKLSGNIGYLIGCECDKSEPFKNILKLKKDEIFVDIGAYRADTVLEFLKYAKSFKKIYAVEPDRKTFAKLKQQLSCKSDAGDIVCINAAAGAFESSGRLEANSGRSSHLSDKGQPVQVVTVDGILNGQRATYIKFDVEGGEHAAIDGARQTIQSFKPRLKIAAYHRTQDLTEIVKQVLEIRDDYKVYMRHHPYIPAWDTDYYFI